MLQKFSETNTISSCCLQMAAAAAAAAVVREAAASAVMDALEGESEEEKSSKMAAAKEDKMRKVIRWETDTSGSSASAGQTMLFAHSGVPRQPAADHRLEQHQQLTLVVCCDQISDLFCQQQAQLMLWRCLPSEAVPVTAGMSIVSTVPKQYCYAQGWLRRSGRYCHSCAAGAFT